jgi:hypothetical protein
MRRTPDPVEHYCATLTPPSQYLAKRALRSVLAVLQPGASLDTYPWHTMKLEDIERIRSTLGQQAAGGLISATRGVLRSCAALGLMSTQACADATKVTRKPASRPALGLGRRRHAVPPSSNFDEGSGDGVMSRDIDSELDDIARIVGV